MLASIHIAKKDLGLDDENYRAILEGVTGKRSCSGMNGPELNRVMDRMRQLGWKPTASPQSPLPKGGEKRGKLSPKTRDKAEVKTQIDKLRALWIEAYQLGVVKNRYEEALNKFVKRVTGIDRIEWLEKEPEKASKVIEVLKKMIKRGEKGE